MAQPIKPQKISEWEEILQIMDTLRDQCPWDRKQTIHTLNNLSIEEMYELSEALNDEDWPGIQEELGDLLLHIVFYAKIAEEQGRFDIADVMSALAQKLKHRHPHIYGDTQADSEEEVKLNWEKLKKKEKKDSYTLDGVPTALPSIIKAYRMQEKAAALGFDWPESEQVLDKVAEELKEIEESTSPEERQQEFGDLLFTLINYARKTGLDPEQALQYTNQKFKNRFTHMEKELQKEGELISDKTLEELEEKWQDAKKV